MIIYWTNQNNNEIPDHLKSDHVKLAPYGADSEEPHISTEVLFVLKR